MSLSFLGAVIDHLRKPGDRCEDPLYLSLNKPNSIKNNLISLKCYFMKICERKESLSERTLIGLSALLEEKEGHYLDFVVTSRQ